MLDTGQDRRPSNQAAKAGAPGVAAALLAGALVAGAAAAFGASTGSALATVQGSSATTAQGDYISASGGLNTYYSAFIEVPPGLSSLVVDLFDADIGAGGGGEAAANRDRGRGTFNTSATYTLRNPSGGVVATLTCNAGGCGTYDNTWVTFTTQSSPTAGHWELRIAQSSGVTGGDDINAVGVRAHDGNSGSGGTELNVYFDSYFPYGTNSPSLTRTYTQYPWITSGCVFDQNDFDWDSNSGSTGSTTYTSRGGGFSTGVGTLSGNDVWLNTVLTGPTSDSAASDYGIWRLVTTITGYNNFAGANGNYGEIYLGNTAAPNPPPSGQPLSNVFRIYLPTDAGTAPVKPYLEQFVTYSSGPNPPQVGQTTRVVVTLRIVNPTARAITFSSPTNVVTSNVPGAGAVYADTVQMTQGSIVSQPSVGGTGNVVWNPGSVAAGATVILAYRVNVTPTSAGQRIPVTGTPTSGGTTARYVDETGNTTQARATSALGPLCGLAATESVLTHALLARFGAFDGAGRMVVGWETSSEAATLGFRLERLAGGKFVPVHEGLLAAPMEAPGGAVYRFVDEAVSPREAATYRLTEVDRRGHERRFGPFQVRADGAVPDDFDPADGVFRAVARPPSPELAPRLAAHRRAQAAMAATVAERANADGGAAKIAVRQTGLTYVAAGALAGPLGTAEATVRALLRSHRLALTLQGQPVAWQAAPGGAGLYFYGEARDSLFSRDTVYRLRPGSGLDMAGVALAPGGGAGGGGFPERRHVEQDRFAATALPLDPASDYWFWEGILAGDPTLGTKSFTVPSPGAQPRGNAALTVYLQGATDAGVAGEHLARVSLGGVELGETSWSGITPHQATFTVAPRLLADGDNTVEVTGLAVSGIPLSGFYVDSFDLAYRRRLVAVGDALALTAGGNPVVRVRGFSTPAIAVYDLSDALRPRAGTGVAVQPAGGAYQASFTPATPQTPYLVVAPAAAAAPAAVWADRPSDLASAANGADYLVIAPAELLAGAEALATERRRFRGLDTQVVDLEDVYDEFSFGQPTPQALVDFLRRAACCWQRPPRYVVLAGDGSYDYRDLLGFGGSLVPPLMVATPSGMYAADALYGDTSGGDGVPEIAVGRLPALTSAELAAYADKIARYEDGEPGPLGLALVADDPDGAAAFGAQSAALGALVGSRLSTLSLDLGQLPLPALRDQLFAALAAGTGAVNYFGHGGSAGLADEGIATVADLPALAAGEHPTVLTGLTCTLNRFELPGYLGFGEGLVMTPDGGAAAVWAPSGLSYHGEAAILGRAFYRRLLDPQPPLLGDAVRGALADYAAAGALPEMLAIYNLLGDPALQVRLPPPPPPPAGGGGGGESKEVE
jgi:Peptidase family C25